MMGSLDLVMVLRRRVRRETTTTTTLEFRFFLFVAISSDSTVDASSNCRGSRKKTERNCLINENKLLMLSWSRGGWRRGGGLPSTRIEFVLLSYTDAIISFNCSKKSLLELESYNGESWNPNRWKYQHKIYLQLWIPGCFGWCIILFQSYCTNKSVTLEPTLSCNLT